MLDSLHGAQMQTLHIHQFETDSKTQCLVESLESNKGGILSEIMVAKLIIPEQ